MIDLILSSSYSEEKKQKNIEKLSIIQFFLNSPPEAPYYFLFRDKESLDIVLNPLLFHLGIYFSSKNIEEISKSIEILLLIFEQNMVSDGEFQLLHFCNHFADAFRNLTEIGDENLTNDLFLLWGMVLEQVSKEEIKKHVSNLTVSEQCVKKKQYFFLIFLFFIFFLLFYIFYLLFYLFFILL